MEKLLNGCEKALTSVAVFATFIMMLLTTADAAGRYLLNRPITGAYEMTTNYLMVCAIFLAMTFAYRGGANIRVTFLVDRLPRLVKLVVNHLVQIFSILYCSALVYAVQASSPHHCNRHHVKQHRDSARPGLSAGSGRTPLGIPDDAR